jgi:hypothetical protein
LGNERLALILLSSMNSKSDTRSTSSKTSTFSEGGSKEVVFRDPNVDSCASQFHSYSVDELRCLDKQILHQILDLLSIEIESQADLLGRLISLGSDYFEF